MPKLSMPRGAAVVLPAWPHLPLVASCALLLGYAHPPALDWPQHQAVGGILAALWRHDLCVSAHYTFVLQPVPYHLLYVVLAPAIALLGSRWGGACTLVLLCLCTHAAFGSWARALRRDACVCALSPLLFFSACFAWGFGPTLAGLPPALMAMAQLARAYRALSGEAETKRARSCVAAAGAWGALSVAAHGVYLPALGLAGLPLLTLAAKKGRGLGLLTLYAALCALPAWPLGASRLWAWLAAAPGPKAQFPELTFETAATGWNHLRLTFAAFDRGPCRNAHQALTCLCVVALALSWRRLGRAERAVAAAAGLHLAMVWLVPLNINASPPAWLLNVRFVPLFEGALWLLVLPAGRRAPKAWPLAHVLCVTTFLLGLSQVFAHFNRAAAYIDVLRHQLPQNTVLPEGGGPRKFDQAWPPLARHLPSALVPHPVCISYNLFVGGHFPIAYRRDASAVAPTSPYPEAPRIDPHGASRSVLGTP